MKLVDETDFVRPIRSKIAVPGERRAAIEQRTRARMIERAEHLQERTVLPETRPKR